MLLLLALIFSYGRTHALAASGKSLQTDTVGTLSDTSMANSGVIVIQGIFDPAGEKLLELKPVHRYSYHSGPIPDQRKGRFAVRVAFASGRITTVPFDALVADDAGRMAHGFFEVTVPVSGEVTSICVTDESGSKTFACVSGAKDLR